uniref:Integrase DNA-binding domain-containing protein n=1 Tax=Candidatus Kentrum sp. DK TaxID=2126562 RepID=A0A450SE78_9GAMM|nr:MAG: protein of unknown function (DUF4102) [Candidatus Kentron sp. DK]
MITNAKIRNAKPGAKPYKIPCEKGLFALVNPNGSKLWRFKYRHNGKGKLLAFGAYPDVSLKDACERRDEARRLREQGIDLSENRKAQRHLGATRERVIEELGKVAFSDPRKLFGEDGTLKPIGSLNANAAASLGSFDIAESGDGETVKKVRLLPKVSALDLLAKHFNLYEDHKQGGAETEIHIHMTEQDMRL